MTEQSEIPEMCKKHDELSLKISNLESNLDKLQDENQTYTEEIKEYFQILKDSKELGIDLPYYQKRIKEIHDELLKNDAVIDGNIEQLDICYKEKDEYLKEIYTIKWCKVAYIFGPPRWYPENEAVEKIKTVLGARRII